MREIAFLRGENVGSILGSVIKGRDLQKIFTLFEPPHQTALKSFINRVVPTHARIEILQMLIPKEGENECLNKIIEDSMVEHVIVRNESPDVADNDDDVNPLPSFEQ